MIVKIQPTKKIICLSLEPPPSYKPSSGVS